MDQQIFQEIAREIKALHNEGVNMIKRKKYEEAKQLYEVASSLSEITGYMQGVAMSMYSISNLEILRDDYIEALKYALISMDCYQEESDKETTSQLIGQLSLYLVKKGIEEEKKGNLEEALNFFEHALPHLKGKRREAVSYEINLLRRVKDNE